MILSYFIIAYFQDLCKKNIKNWNNKPLLFWVCDALDKSSEIDEFWIASDSEEINNIFNEFKFSKGKIYNRSIKNSQDKSSTESVLIEFINNITKNSEKINKLKIKNSIKSTSFNKLKSNEEKFGFSESVKSKKDNRQIPFFFLGPDNNWNKILNDELKNKLNKVFDKNLKEFSYIE